MGRITVKIELDSIGKSFSPMSGVWLVFRNISCHCHVKAVLLKIHPGKLISSLLDNILRGWNPPYLAESSEFIFSKYESQYLEKQ